jgi:hypothetical protein
VSGQRPGIRWRGLRLVLGVAGAVLIAGVIAGCEKHDQSDDAQIRQVVDQFAKAVDRLDQPAILGLLCKEEADEMKDDDDFDPDAAPLADPEVRSVQASDIQVNADTANARISRPGQQDITLWFRREGSTWKVCAPAADNATPSPSASSAPA